MAAPSASVLTAPADGATIDPTGGLILFQWTASAVPDDPPTAAFSVQKVARSPTADFTVQKL